MAVVLLLVLALQAFGAGVALAGDIYLNLWSPLRVPLLSSSTGTLTWGVQEGAYSLLGSTTGVSPDHYYIWVCYNGQCVLAVDPLRIQNN